MGQVTSRCWGGPWQDLDEEEMREGGGDAQKVGVNSSKVGVRECV